MALADVGDVDRDLDRPQTFGEGRERLVDHMPIERVCFGNRLPLRATATDRLGLRRSPEAGTSTASLSGV